MPLPPYVAPPPLEEHSGPRWPLWAARLLALAAAVISTYLGWASATQAGHVAGCSNEAGFDCAAALTSRWSVWFGLPVGLPASIVYLSLLGALLCVSSGADSNVRRWAWRVALPLAALAAGAGLWFIGLQMFAIQSFCWYCLLVHCSGLVLAVLVVWVALQERRVPAKPDSANVLVPGLARSAAIGLSGVALLIAGQVLGPGPSAKMQVVEIAPIEPAKTAPVQPDTQQSPAGVASKEHPGQEPAPSHSGATGSAPSDSASHVPSVGERRIQLLGGKATLQVSKLPLLGQPEAPALVVELFDYTCPHFRQMHVYLTEVRQRFKGQLAVIVLPMPMNRNCNPYVQLDEPMYKDACDLARLAWAVWYAKPAAFDAFHAWLLDSKAPPPLAAARSKAEELVGRAELAESLADQRIEGQIKAAGYIYKLAGLGEIPKLLSERYVTSGEPASADELAQTLAKQLELKP